MTAAQIHQRRWTTLRVLALSLVIIGLDNTILNVALPSLREHFDASNSTLQWIVDSYLLVFAGLPVACLTFAARFARWGERSWAVISLITGLILVVTFVGLVVGFNGWKGPVLGAGVIQRLFIVVGWGWIAVLALYLRRSVASGW